jgi:hypothetical protein
LENTGPKEFSMAAARRKRTAKSETASEQSSLVEGAPALDLLGFGSTITDLLTGRSGSRKRAATSRRKAKRKSPARASAKSKAKSKSKAKTKTKTARANPRAAARGAKRSAAKTTRRKKKRAGRPSSR